MIVVATRASKRMILHTSYGSLLKSNSSSVFKHTQRFLLPSCVAAVNCIHSNAFISDLTTSESTGHAVPVLYRTVHCTYNFIYMILIRVYTSYIDYQQNQISAKCSSVKVVVIVARVLCIAVNVLLPLPLVFIFVYNTRGSQCMGPQLCCAPVVFRTLK